MGEVGLVGQEGGSEGAVKPNYEHDYPDIFVSNLRHDGTDYDVYYGVDPRYGRFWTMRYSPRYGDTKTMAESALLGLLDEQLETLEPAVGVLRKFVEGWVREECQPKN